MEKVNHPPHYQKVSEIGRPILMALGLTDKLLAMECIEAIEWLEQGGKTFTYLNAVKYLWRCGLKSEAKLDLEKARWYLQRCRHDDKNRRAVAMIDELLTHQAHQESHPEPVPSIAP